MVARRRPKSVVDTRKLVIALCLESFQDFAREFWPEVPGAGNHPHWGWHMDLICDELQIIAERVFANLPKLHDLVINVSPGTSKSTLVSILFPAWVWTRMPSARIITASHTDDLTLDLATKSQTVITCDKYRDFFPGVVLTKDAKGYFTNSAGGDRKTCTVAGKSPMGFHGNILLVDDPIDPKKAMSDAEVKAAKYFYDAVIPSRKVDKTTAVEVTIMQRLGEEDPTAHVLRRAKKDNTSIVRHICLPASLPQSDDGEYLPGNVNPPELAGKYQNGLMDPVRLPRATLDSMLATMGIYAYSGQYNQCLVKGVLVMTGRGSVPIEAVNLDDVVLTRGGWKRVLWSGRTGITSQLSSALFSDGSVLVGTGNHPVWCVDNGWVPIDALSGGMYNTALWEENERKPLKSCSLTDRISVGAPENGIFAGGTGNVLSDSTVSCGFTTTEVSPLATTSITRTTTRLTIELKILSASLRANMDRGTPTAQKSVVDFLLKSVNSVCPGNSPRKVKNTIARSVESLSSGCGTPPSIEIILADVVARNSAPEKSLEPSPYTVRRSARRKIASGRTAKTVLCAESHSRPGTIESPPAPDPAPPSGGDPGVEVFDVTVEDAHEFFANGILVHNSPVPLGGGMFKVEWFNNREKAAPYHALRVRFWDRAATADGGCYTAGVLMAKGPDGSYWVENVVHGQWEPDRRNDVMKATALRDRARYGPDSEPYLYVEAEGGSSGRDAWKGVMRALEGFACYEVRVSGNKDRRAEPWSSQLASRNVKIVDDGSWDVANYVDEHVRFRPEDGITKRGRFKDQVDASTGAFNLLVGQLSGRFQVLSSGRQKAKAKIAISRYGELASLALENKAAVVLFHDPGTEVPVLPEVHPLTHVLCHVAICVADLEPAAYQDHWDEPVDGYGKKPVELIMNAEHGKRLWAFLTKKRDPVPEAFVFADLTGEVASSAALAVADMLRLPRASVFRASAPESKCDGLPANQHVYGVVKASRGLVVT